MQKGGERPIRWHMMSAPKRRPTRALPHSCDRCRRPTWARIVFFRQNISYLWGREETTFCGRLCLRCMTRIFLKFTLTTLLLTWFGIIGVAIGPIIIVMNLTEYVGALLGVVLFSCRKPAA